VVTRTGTCFLARITEAPGIVEATGSVLLKTGSDDFEGAVTSPANEAVGPAGGNSGFIESGNDWQEKRNNRKLQLSNFSFMGIGFQPE
jgi:hypothetical protein